MLASGVAALAATFTTVLNRGDHAIFSDTVGALLSVDNTFNSPFNAWLINRGLVTLPLRMRQHNASTRPSPSTCNHCRRCGSWRIRGSNRTRITHSPQASSPARTPVSAGYSRSD